MRKNKLWRLFHIVNNVSFKQSKSEQVFEGSFVVFSLKSYCSLGVL